MNSPPQSPPNSPPDSIRPDRAGRLLIGLEGAELSDADRNRLAHPAVGGAILFARNFNSAAQLRRLCAQIRRAAPRRLLLAADHEGGRVQRFGPPDFTPIPPMREIPSNNAARDCGIVAAAELLAAGLDLSFAPVADLDSGHSAVIGDRAFSSNPDIVAARALAFANGAKQAGMHSCAKHFPGHGKVAADSHHETPTDSRPLSQLRAADLIPFRQWANAGMSAVMTAHVVYSDSDSHPATYSRFWLREILRDELGFRGVIVGDDLSMEGANIGDIGARITQALAAGCDALMICQPENVDEALQAAAMNPDSKLNSTSTNADSNSDSDSDSDSDSNADSPWLKLSARPDGRITVGDVEYEQARERMEQRWQ